MNWSVKSVVLAAPSRDGIALAREFVDDILDQGGTDYQTFRDGWIYQEVIDIVRSGSGWTPVAADL